MYNSSVCIESILIFIALYWNQYFEKFWNKKCNKIRTLEA